MASLDFLSRTRNFPFIDDDDEQTEPELRIRFRKTSNGGIDGAGGRNGLLGQLWHRLRDRIGQIWKLLNSTMEEKDKNFEVERSIQKYVETVMEDRNHPLCRIVGIGPKSNEMELETVQRVSEEESGYGHPLQSLLEEEEKEVGPSEWPEGNPAAADDAFSLHWNNQQWNAQERPVQVDLGYDEQCKAFWNHSWWNNAKWAAGTAYHELIGAMEHAPTYANEELSAGAWNPQEWRGRQWETGEGADGGRGLVPMMAAITAAAIGVGRRWGTRWMMKSDWEMR